jgi:hypothetical protein
MDAVAPLAVELAESAVLGWLEPKPISACYEDELLRIRREILLARDAHRTVRRSRASLKRRLRQYALRSPDAAQAADELPNHGSTSADRDSRASG